MEPPKPRAPLVAPSDSNVALGKDPPKLRVASNSSVALDKQPPQPRAVSVAPSNSKTPTGTEPVARELSKAGEEEEGEENEEVADDDKVEEQEQERHSAKQPIHLFTEELNIARKALRGMYNDETTEVVEALNNLVTKFTPAFEVVPDGTKAAVRQINRIIWCLAAPMGAKLDRTKNPTTLVFTGSTSDSVVLAARIQFMIARMGYKAQIKVGAFNPLNNVLVITRHQPYGTRGAAWGYDLLAPVPQDNSEATVQVRWQKQSIEITVSYPPSWQAELDKGIKNPPILLESDTSIVCQYPTGGERNTSLPTTEMWSLSIVPASWLPESTPRSPV